jgi:hypothetical protein
MNASFILSVAMLGATQVAALEDPVDAGREALGRQSTSRSYPWYDQETDAPRKVEEQERAIRSGGSSGSAFGLLNFLAWGAIIAVLVLLAYLVVRNLEFDQRESIEAPRPGMASEVSRLEDLPFPVRRPVGDLLAEARRQYEQGNYGEAMVYLYSHLLVTLDRAQLIRLTKGKTNRQYLRELAGPKTLAAILAGAMVAFEDFFFGKHDLGRERFEQSWHRLDEFARLVQRGAET